MSRLACGLRALLLLGAVSAATATATPDPATATTAGKPIFGRRCAECHAPGPGHPGTQRLAAVRGPERAILEQRTDLVPAYIAAIVRNGFAEMPAFRPTELSDAELGALAEYLSQPDHHQGL